MVLTTPLLPSSIPLLPLPPPQVLYPFLRTSFHLSQHQLDNVLDALLGPEDQGGDGEVAVVKGRIVAAVPVADGDSRVGRWACAASVKAVERDGDAYRMVVEGIARIYLPRSLPPTLSILPGSPITYSDYSIPLPSPAPITTNLLPYAKCLLPSQVHQRLSAIPPPLMADLLVTVLQVEWKTRVELLGVPDADVRVERVRNLMKDMLTERGMAIPVEEGQSRKDVKRIPAVTSRPPPAQRPSSSTAEDDELAPLNRRFQSRQSELSPLASSTLARELKRLKGIMPMSPEYGVVKTYVEWLLALPWKRVDEVDVMSLEAAREKLDEDHEGLRDVKRRVVEYLAVYRLKQQLFLEQKQAAIKESLESKENVASPVNPSDERKVELLPSSEQSSAASTPTPTHTPANSPDIKDNEEGPPNDTYRDKGPILLLVGPPGVGKTSIARSIAASLGRKFHRISLGGVRDEAEIRGHRRTYVGALPGALVQAMKKVGVANPVILLDEVDKMGTSNYNGDPSAALLEALDPAQNWAFHDHYLGDVPIDLSRVLFISTANDLKPISHPLLDRCEIIPCPGYLPSEKISIALKHLLPRQIEEAGLPEGGVVMGEEVVGRLVEGWTWESGVRGLERGLGGVCRSKAVEWSKHLEGGGERYERRVGEEDLERYLGPSENEVEEVEEMKPGIVNGLTYDSSGNGGVLVLETVAVPGGKGELEVTGQLGEVFRESVGLCLTWVKAHAVGLGIPTSKFKSTDIHYHAPAGAIKKDGPSAGVGTVLALVSLLTDRPMPRGTAVTGEMSLRGRVLRVGGIREKVTGAFRMGMTKVILPRSNQPDVERDVPEDVKKKIKFDYVGSMEEALETVWGKGIWAREDGGERGRRMVGEGLEARL
ncbi:ATP-dependent protease La [Cryptococcus floricola]|uniref:endopeptidase La n=1 Tax=Cryptococcus floricola TaxID=2591691 RepID=A0A5D3AP24_9TREE|nr:ATP-dependent protease La [Cryptococcus floricola]